MLLNIFQAWSMIKACAWSSSTEAALQMATRFSVVFPICIGANFTNFQKLITGSGIPLLVSFILWFSDTGFFYRNDQFCWIRPQSVIYAILIPVTVMLLNSSITFAIFCVRMFPDFFARVGVRRTSIKMAEAQKRQRRRKMELFLVLFFAQFYLGFPWVSIYYFPTFIPQFQILQYPAMFSSKSTVWHYLFAIFNGSNGLILFLIFAYGRAQAFYRLRKGIHSSTQQTASTNVEE
jgi:hypothetical protein